MFRMLVGSTHRFHIFGNSIVDSSTEVMSKCHPPVTTVAHHRIQLFEVAVVQEPSKECSHGLYVNLEVDALGLCDGIISIVFMLWQLVLAEPGRSAVSDELRIGEFMTYNVHDFHAILIDNFEGFAYSSTAGRESVLRVSRK